MAERPDLRLYSAIGECLGAWSAVEVEVSHLFMILQERPWDDFDHPLRVAFEAVISLEVRLAMIKASVGVDPRYKAEYAQHFNALYNKIMKSYKKRHEVAHFMPIIRVGELGKGFSIQPFFNWHDFRNKTGRGQLDAAQIEERKASFDTLRERVNRHKQHVGAMRGLPPEYFAQAGDLAHPPLGLDDLNPE